jgi:hypothetical protein
MGNKIKTLYRAQEFTTVPMSDEPSSWVFKNRRIRYSEYFVLSETPKGYWISLKYYKDEDRLLKSEKKWVSKTSKKRFAYTTKKEALIAFIKRKEKQIKILESQLYEAKTYLKIAKKDG